MAISDPRAWWRRVALSTLIAPTLLLAYLQASHANEERARATRHVPSERPAAGYVSSKACRACHVEQYASWYASYHRSMTQTAARDSVRAPFAGESLTHGQQRIVLSEQAGRFTMRAFTPSGPERSALRSQPLAPVLEGQYPVSLVTGSHHMQVYWYETGRGRALGQLPFVYLQDDARWVPRHMVFLRPAGLPRAGELGRWNSSCLHCHSTRAEPRLGPGGAHDTRVAELGIACEACHGPGREHIRQMASPLARYSSYLLHEREHPIVNPAKLDASRASAVCSQCHASWQLLPQHARDHNRTGSAYRPGDDPEATQWLFAPSRQQHDPRVRSAMLQDREYAPGQFWSDGQARVSGREYNGMIESPCMQGGQLSCLSCHSMHREPGDPRSAAQWADDQLARGKGNDDGDAACLGCHRPIARAPTEHTRHAQGSVGGRCYNCHMPHTSWGLLKAMRTHRIGSPSVQETLQTGRPNACTLCHLDRSLRWVAQMLQTRFGVAPPAAQALSGQPQAVAAGVSLSLSADAGQRALLAAAMRRPEVQRAAGTSWMPAVLGVLMDDPYDAVRYVAGHALQSLPGFTTYPYDFVQRPNQRPAVASDLAQRAAAQVVHAAQSGELSPELPFTADGLLSPEVSRALMAQRDRRPVHLLE